MDLPPLVREHLADFTIRREKLEEIRDSMYREFKLGLEIGSPPSSVAMIPSFVPAVPDGNESGEYLTIDLSGKNLRVLFVRFHGKSRRYDTEKHNYMVPKEIMVGTGAELFDFIVSCLEKFLVAFNLIDKELPLGFVFSYPCEMKGINSARLLFWTKGFNVEDCLHQDVGRLLKEAVKRNGKVKVNLKAIMNDTVGQLASSAYVHGQECIMGVVIGYGCNSSYLEDVANVKKFDAAKNNYPFPKIVIDTEWEEFGSHGELDGIKTKFDLEIDESSVHKGRQSIDKLTGAFFLGELVRLILDQLCVDNLLFGGSRPEALQSSDAFPTKFISEILSDADSFTPFCNTRRIMEELQIPLHGTMDYVIIREVCHAVSLRSASIVAAAISALMKVINQPKMKIGVGGALIQFHPTYYELLVLQLNELAPSNVTEWNLVQTEAGSGTGAALVAAVVEKTKAA